MSKESAGSGDMEPASANDELSEHLFAKGRKRNDERAETQKKTFAKWICYTLEKGGKSAVLYDLVEDMKDGHILLELLEVLTGRKMKQEKGRMRVHKLNNVNRALQLLEEFDVKLVNIGSDDIVNGSELMILALIWNIILKFQVTTVIDGNVDGVSISDLEKSLIDWCKQCTEGYIEVDVKNFSSSWKDGLAFNALIHYHRPDLFDFKNLLGKTANESLAHAFTVAKEKFGIAPLLDPEDVNTDHPDRKSIMMYVTTLFEVLPMTKSVREVLPERADMSDQAARSDSPTPSSVSTMSEWDDYNETLTQVLAWLLQAETQLKHQEPVSDNVDQVKEQFREHEEFMMILTSHQTSVGSVLEFGSQLINEGIVQGKEEREIREQMTLLSDRWENLRVAAMQRQSDLHQALMKLQQLQLQELGDWLAKAESKIKLAGAIGSDLETVKRQVETHKKFQEDLEHQQHHVNSLSHMVVVVDESESENATADLEKQLTLLGERWSVVCKWTEQRWAMLQEVLKSWQRYRSEEQRLSLWLSEKERALKEISVIDMGDKNEVQKQIDNLKSLELELTQQQATFGDFNLAAQSVAQTLDEDSVAIRGIQETMEDFNRRWNTIASMLNTKMKHLKSMEGKLNAFLHELEENMAWISDTEMLLKPQANPQPELIESLDQMVKKRRTSILALNQTGEDLIAKTATAGQSVLGLEQTLNNFMGRWEALVKLLDNRKANAEASAKRKIFMEELQRIQLIITETTTYIDMMTVEFKNKPKELLEKLKAKMTEVQLHKTRLDQLHIDCKSLVDPALKSALEAELLVVTQKFSVFSQFMKDKQNIVTEIIQSTPPPEFAEKISAIRSVIDEVFPAVSCEFKYDDIEKMRGVAEGLKLKLKRLHEQEGNLAFLTKQQKDLLKSLAEDKMLKFQKQLSDLNRQWIDCKKIAEARQQRVNEAITQTKELETAMKETFNWMDDVDKFLEEITGTIAEGDPETIDSQVQEVEALQLDIATVQKKVDSLIETCNLIVSHAEPSCGSRLKSQLENLTTRWTGIKLTTDKQKENLRNAGLRFKEVNAGVQGLLLYLKGVEAQTHIDKLRTLEPGLLKIKLDEYQEIFRQFKVKGSDLEKHRLTLKQLISSAPGSNEAPPIQVDVDNAFAIYSSMQAKLSDCVALLVTANGLFNELEVLLSDFYKILDHLDDEIASSSEKLDGDDADLDKCLQEVDRLNKALGSDSEKKVRSVVQNIAANGAGVPAAQSLMDDYQNRLHDTKERCKKVRFILEGELSKRQQLRRDLVQLESWIKKWDAELQQRIDTCAPDDSAFNKCLKDEISLNDALILSVDRMIAELQDSGNPERHSHLLKQLQEIHSKWQGLIAKFASLQAQPVRELERRFIELQGTILSDIDNLKRKAKKAKLDSPAVQDIQRQKQALQNLFETCHGIQRDIERLRNYATDLSKLNASGLDRQVKEVEDEYQHIGKALRDKEVLFNNAMGLSESVFGHLDGLEKWLAELRKEVDGISLEPLPATPEDSMDQLQKVANDMAQKASDVELLCKNTAVLGKLSDDPSFRAVESRVQLMHESYVHLGKIAQEKLGALQEWVREIDNYEDSADCMNVWIDGRLATLESIGGMSAKWDIEMELQKLKGLKSVIKSKECDMETLKRLGGEISSKGRRSIVDPFEQRVCQRWDDMEQKIAALEKSLCEKLKLIEKEDNQPPEKRRIIEEEEKRPAVRITVSSHKKKVHVMESESVTLVESALMASDESCIQPVTVNEQFAVSPRSDEAVTVDIPSPNSEVPVKAAPTFAAKSVSLSTAADADGRARPGLQRAIDELEEIETALRELKPKPGDASKVQKDIEDLEDRLCELQLKTESLLNETRDGSAAVSHTSGVEIARKITRQISRLHAGIAVKKQIIKEVFYDFCLLQKDLASVDAWLTKFEEAIRNKFEPQALKDVERNFEKNVAEIEAVNARAEHLSRCCSTDVVSKQHIIELNKRFKAVVSYVEKYQRPEEKVTNYKISVLTGDMPDADTRANVSVKLFGEYGNSDQLNLRQSETRRKKFQPGQVDLFTFRDQPWLGKLTKLRVWHDNEGASPAWYLSSIYVFDELSERLYCYVIDAWLSKDKAAVLKEVPVSAMTPAKEIDKDVLVKKHVVSDVRWLFDKLDPASKDRPLKPYQEVMQDMNATSKQISYLELRLKDTAKPGHTTLEEASAQLGKIGPVLNNFMLLRERYVASCTADEMHEIDLCLMSMRTRWNAVNKEFKQLHLAHAQPPTLARCVAPEMDDLLHWLSYAEDVLSTTSGEVREMVDYRELEEDLRANEAKLKALKAKGADSNVAESKLEDVGVRLATVRRQVSEKKQQAASSTDDVKLFLDECEQVQSWLLQVEDLITKPKPHPVDENALEEYARSLRVAEDEFSAKQESLFKLKNSSKQLVSRVDGDAESQQHAQSRFEKLQEHWNGASLALGNRRQSVEIKLARSSRFLEELEELSAWMAATRDLLEGQSYGKPGFNVDPETMKQALETRKSNVESINALLRDFKKEGELASGRFPADVSVKIAQLNSDWQVIIRLATQLREQPVAEEVVIAEVMKEDESAGAIDFEVPIDEFESIGAMREEFKLKVSADYSSTNAFDANVARLHDWLKLIETKLKVLTVVVGDVDEMDSALQKQTTMQLEMEAQKNFLEDTIEMGAALSMDTNSDSVKYTIDDKISKMKEHWEVVWEKVVSNRRQLEELLGDWRRFCELRAQLDNWIRKAELHFNEDRGIGKTVNELEAQLADHKKFLEDLAVWQNTFAIFQQIAHAMAQRHSMHQVNELKNIAKSFSARWDNLKLRSNSRQQSLQEALDRLLQFHKNMISALTWLSSAESKVAELDSLVEASQAEDASDVEELQREMFGLEEDVSNHQVMFRTLNETGTQIMLDLEPGEVRTALQSKLDDMNDRWSSLGVRVIDIRDRMSDGAGEWRQLQLDMQEIIDWLVRADQELQSQKPIAADVQTVQGQNANHQLFKGKLNVRRVVIEQAINQGRASLAAHDKRLMDPSFRQKSNDHPMILRAAENLQKQISHVQTKWSELMKSSDEWQKTLDLVLDLLHQLVNQIDHLDARLIEAERLRGQWSPVAQITLTTVQEHVDEITLFNKTVSGYETLIDNMDGTAKELRHLHGVKLSAVTEGTLQQVHDRWKRLRLDASVRLRDLQGLQGQPTLQEPGGSGGLSALQGSVESPWERGAALNKVPYYINHNTKTTQWDHPKMTDLYHTLSELNDVKFAAYRTAMKLRCIQKAICLDMVDLKDVIVSAFKADRALANNDQLVDIDEMITVLLAVFENVDPKRKEVINIPQSVDMTLNWLLNVYDSGRIGKIRVLSFKVGVVLLSRARIEEKYAYLFSEATSGSGLMNSKKLGLLLHDAVQIPRQLGEIAAFGGSNIEPSVRSCFEKAKSPQQIDSAQFLDWTSAEPQSLVWVPVLHRLAAAETAKHEAKCNICKEYPIIGFRYRCLKCFNYDLCQSCFWSGRVSKTHRITHPMHQYSLATTTGEDLSDFVKLMKNKFKSRKYRSRPPKKLGYLPVQTIMEGSSIETPSIPATPDMSFSFSSFDSTPSSPTKFRFDVINEEHRLIQQMAQSLNGDANGSSPQSPSQILARLDSEQKQDINDIIRELEDEHKSLEAEYTRLKSVRAPPREASSILPRGAEFAGEAEVVAEAKILKQHKGRLEARMQILEDHNRQLEAQLQRLRQLLEQPPGERDRAAFSMNVSGPPSPTRLTMTVAADASPGGSLPARANRGAPVVNGYSSPGDGGGGRVQNVSR